MLDAVGICLAVSAIAANLAIKAREFKNKMKNSKTLLDGLIRYCDMIEKDARMIAKKAEQVKRIYGLNDIDALDEDDPWRVLTVRIADTRVLLGDFDKELDKIAREDSKTWLRRAIIQIRADDAMPRIEQIQQSISQNCQSLAICIQLAFHYDPSWTPCVAQQLPTPPTTPTSDISATPEDIVPATPSRTLSNASTLNGSPSVEIDRVVKNLDIATLERLLAADKTGQLLGYVDSHERTLLDIAICFGKSTHRSKVPLVRMLRDRGVKFTLEDRRHRSTYKEIVQTIDLQARKKR